MSMANFEKRIEKEFLISKLIAKGAQEKGISKDDLVKELIHGRRLGFGK